MALRMGGAAPHLGMVLTKGSLSAYSIERDLKLQSNDRGCFWLHPSAQEFAPGDTMTLEWKVFPHQGREDFREKLRAFSQVILVDAEQYVIYPGETSKVTIEPTFPAEKVTVNGVSLEKTEKGVYEYLFENEKTGEYVLSICVDEVKTICRLLVQERPEELAAKRCAFIVDHQQYHGKIKELQGAYLPYDNEEKILVCTPENDFNAGRERTGMGVLIARALQQNLLKDREKAEQSLREYHAFYLRELVNAATGLVCNCSGKDNSYFRLYNYPWAVTFFLECWKLWGEKEDLKTAVHITEKFYEQDGFRFYPIEMPIVMLCQELEKAGEQEDLKTVRDLFRRHADQLIEIGTAYPASEVNYEQSIVQPAAEVILQVYEVTGEEKYLRGAEQQIAVLELFDGQQPDYHLHEIAIRHWDGYWFGKRRVFGDTFPHYWSKSHKVVVYDEMLGENGEENPESGRFDMVEKLEAMTPDERYAFWRGELSRCIRCNACRNICPACSCEQCVFDNPASGVSQKAAADSFEENMFHIIRAFHVAGRCTDCGECSRVCPQHIPLHLLNRKFIKDIDTYYGEYQAGAEAGSRAPLVNFTKEDCEPNVVYKGGSK